MTRMAFVTCTGFTVKKPKHNNAKHTSHRTKIMASNSISAFDEPDMQKVTFRPSESYQNRNFAHPLQKTWSGELSTSGAWERPISTSFLEEVVVPPESSEAFSRLQRDLAMERRESLRRLEDQKKTPKQGRPTCGPEEGVGVFSNASDFGTSKIKCVEYWGRPGRMFQE
ncbi:hypothetical protein GAYE_SCF00G1812 [Galdieria yellowstonensis]|uniref:Uncharacterized protein n=1 Tax=Galdieria yellowstonensis TaxID=3028027 RepID=A0AAV9I940_9RHOD|nr:hypothetical protein GAYE_SCF00G1812 [Galdieria yellowstonensis]